jgi:hypothetical protein
MTSISTGNAQLYCTRTISQGPAACVHQIDANCDELLNLFRKFVHVCNFDVNVYPSCVTVRRWSTVRSRYHRRKLLVDGVPLVVWIDCEDFRGGDAFRFEPPTRCCAYLPNFKDKSTQLLHITPGALVPLSSRILFNQPAEEYFPMATEPIKFRVEFNFDKPDLIEWEQVTDGCKSCFVMWSSPLLCCLQVNYVLKWGCNRGSFERIPDATAAFHRSYDRNIIFKHSSGELGWGSQPPAAPVIIKMV